MRKFGLGVFLVFCVVTVSFASLERNMTAGLFYNDFDNIMHVLDIQRVDRNIANLAYQSWRGTDTSWEGTVGLVNVLPVKLGVDFTYRESLLGTPEFTTTERVTLEDLLGDGFVDNKNVLSTSRYEFDKLANREITAVVGLSPNLGVAYQFANNANRVDATYNTNFAISTGSSTKNYDLSGNLLNETAALYGIGFNDNTDCTHRVIAGLGFGENAQLLLGLSYEIGGQDRYAIQTNYTYYPGANIEYPSYAVAESFRYNKIHNFGFNPQGKLFLANDGVTELAIILGLDVGMQMRGLGGLYEQTINETTTKTPNGAFVETTSVNVENDSYYSSYFGMPISLNVNPYLLRKLSDRISVGIGADLTTSYSFLSYRSLGTNVTTTTYDNGEGISNDPNNYTEVAKSFNDVFDYSSNVLSLNLYVPIALQAKLTDAITLRIGTRLGLDYSNEVEQSIFVDKTPDVTTTTYGDGTVDTDYGTPTTGATDSSREVNTTYTTSTEYFAGVGFNITEDLTLDVMLATEGDIWNLTRWNVELGLRF
jgi:hypothetical protein